MLKKYCLSQPHLRLPEVASYYVTRPLHYQARQSLLRARIYIYMFHTRAYMYTCIYTYIRWFQVGPLTKWHPRCIYVEHNNKIETGL